MYRYTLSSSQKGICPECGRMTLSLYVDTQTGQIVDLKVGLCNHGIGSRYHYPPRKYFIDNNKKNHKQKTEIVMKSEMESQQEQNNPTSEEVTTRSLNADGNKVEKNRTTEEEVNSPIVNTDTNESKQEDETEYYDFDTLDDIEVELPQGKIRRFPPTSKVEPKDPFQAMW